MRTNVGQLIEETKHGVVYPGLETVTDGSGYWSVIP